MWTLGRAHRLPAFSLLIVGALSLAVPGLATTAAATAHPHPAGVRPNAVGELDCNGLSPIQRPVKPNLVCADPRGPYGGRFYDNGHYIGHDEPSVRFISSRPGSGSNVAITESLPRDPTALLTAHTIPGTGGVPSVTGFTVAFAVSAVAATIGAGVAVFVTPPRLRRRERLVVADARGG